MAQESVLFKSCRIKNQILKEFLAEMVGTFILVLVCDCAIAVQVLSKPHQIDILAIGFATGMALMLCFYGASRLSGGHVNPVVTFSLVALGKLPFWKIFHYFAGQYIGGFLATMVAYLNHYSAIAVFDGGVRSAFFNATSTAGILTSHPAHHLTLTGAFIDQIICCALLMLGILCIVDHHNLNTPKPLIPIALFVLLAGLIAAFGLNCGPALNPARDIPARIFAYLIGYGSEVWAPHSHFYWLIGGLMGPHIGGVLGTWIYHLGLGLHLDDEQLG